MRTTLTLDPDIAERLRLETANGRKSLKQAVNERLRIGFGIVRPQPEERYAVKAHKSAYRAGIDRARLNQALDELEAEAFIQNQRTK